MKNKLQALIAEQKALTAKFEEVVNEPDIHKTNGTLDYEKLRVVFNALMKTYTTQELIECAESIAQEQSINPKKVYIKGHPTRGDEVIKMLEDLGGMNKYKLGGINVHLGFYITRRGIIDAIAPKYLIGHTELHLPEEDSAENAHTTDIKVGDWYLLDEPCLKCELSDRMKVEPFVIDKISASFDSDVAIVKFADGVQSELYKFKDKFHKVDPPKKEVEQQKFMTSSDAIVGDIYTVLADQYRYIFIHNGFVSNCSFKPLCIIRFDESMDCLSAEGTLDASYVIIESSKDEKDYILKAIEYNGKHFDKENMRLLDVEEWSKEHQNYPVICRNDNNMPWSVKIMCKYVNGRALVRTKSTQKQWMSQAIPYNDQTKHLIGTTNLPDKHYKFVEQLTNKL